MRTLLVLALSLIALPRIVAADEPPPFDIDTIDAQTVRVELIGIDAKTGITCRAGREEARFALDDILRITPIVITDATAPSQATGRVLDLAGGGVLCGRLMVGDDRATRTVRIELIADHIMDIPFTRLAAIRLALTEDAAMQPAFAQRAAAREPGRDFMVVAKNGKPLIVPGSLEALGPDGWAFHFGGTTRSAGLDQVYGFVFGAPAVAPPRRPATVLLTNGNRFTATIVSADAEAIALDADAFGPVTLQWPHIRLIDLRSERIVHVSDLQPSKTEQRSEMGLSWPPRMNSSVTGKPLRLGKRTYTDGIGVHAYTALTYQVDGAYERFDSLVGVDDSVGPAGSVVFRVKADGRTLHETKTLRGTMAPARISVDITAAKTLTLECDAADELDLSDHADWVNAILIRAKQGATP